MPGRNLLVGLGAAAYSPAKYGILTEYLPPDQLVKANSWMEGLTVAAIILGAVVGGIAGSEIGQGKGSAVGTVLGAVGGAVAGHAIEEATTRKGGLEITVKLEGGRTLAVVQEADEAFRPGERVRVLSGGGVTRVTH